ncbi:hypothetical protein ALC56_07624 [Trachymyrmex septentrionalis]|uniref:Uncharacterized protein n=1 Tax=Trachymyrmex septentrionalis TaxID=34720 RepID=A0A195FBJ8_9HYME|nr:hypothetical protein ALC56_07624 [Trachymyrmex septentrionalis]
MAVVVVVVVAVAMVVELADAGVRVWKRAREDEGEGEGRRETDSEFKIIAHRYVQTFTASRKARLVLQSEGSDKLTRVGDGLAHSVS